MADRDVTQRDASESRAKWAKLPALPGFQHCNMCPPKPDLLPLDAPLSVGFGTVTVSKGDETLWDGDDFNTRLRQFEIAARKDPDNDWRVTFYAPLYEAEYQRVGTDPPRRGLRMSDHSLLRARLEWEAANPRPESLLRAERAIVRALADEFGKGQQFQVTRHDGFDIAIADLLIRVEVQVDA